MNEKAASQIKNLLVILAVVLFIAYSIYAVLLRQTNEIGPIGVDKDGRQIFLQTLDAVNKDNGLRVTSEWESTTFLERMFIKEPMRTTIRFVMRGSTDISDVLVSRAYLDMPWSNYFRGAPPEGKMHLREDVEVLLPEFYMALEKLGAKTNEDMFAAMGFRHYEVYRGDALVALYDLDNIGRGNVKHMGGD